MIKKPISILTLISIISAASLYIIINKFEPCVGYSAASFCSEVNTGSLIFLQANLFLFTTSFLSLCMYLIRSIASINLARSLGSSIRQSILISVFLQFAMTAKFLGILEIWNSVLVFAILATIDSLFQQR